MSMFGDFEKSIGIIKDARYPGTMSGFVGSKGDFEAGFEYARRYFTECLKIILQGEQAEHEEHYAAECENAQRLEEETINQVEEK